MSERRLHILIVRLSHLGDVVHALPLLSALRAAHPAARIAWAVQPEFADLLRDRGDLDEILLFDRRGGARAWMRLRRDLEAFGADWTIDAQGNVKSALVLLASGAPRRSGFARADWTEPFAASSSNDPAPAAVRASDGATHAMQRMQALVEHVAPSIRFEDACRTSSPDARMGDQLFTAWFGAARGPFVVMHASDERDVRSWRAQAFVDLACDLAHDHDVLVMAGPGERAEGLAAQRSLSGVARVECVVDQSGLAALDAFLRAAARREAVFVGCDSGPMHLAWSAGMRVVLLAGPQDERRTGPWPVPQLSTELAVRSASDREHAVVRAEAPPACAPCLQRTCTHRDGNVCMTRIAPGRVAAVVRAMSASASQRGDEASANRTLRRMQPA